MRFLTLCTAALCALVLLAASAQADPSGRRGRCGSRAQLRAKLLERFDANGDGQLDESERATAKAAFEAKRAERKQQVLEKFDTNGDGRLSDGEKATAKEAAKAKVKEHFDANGDGTLDAAERRARRRAMRHRGRMRHRRGGGRDGAGPITPR